MNDLQKGFSGLIRVCPQAARQEFFNVGLFLYAPASSFFRVECLPSLQAITRFTRESWLRQPIVRTSLEAIEATMRRMFDEKGRDPEVFLAEFHFHFQRYANEFRVSELRPLKLREPEATFRSLFEELVLRSAHARKPRKKKESPSDERLRSFFRSKSNSPKIRLDLRFPLPFGSEHFEIPYAYQNGVWNLIKPVLLPPKPREALKQAEALITEARLLFSLPEVTEDYPDASLLLLPTFPSALSSEDFERLWTYFELRYVLPPQIEEWLSTVETHLVED